MTSEEREALKRELKAEILAELTEREERGEGDMGAGRKAQGETRLLRHFSRPNVYADLWLHCEKCGEKVNDNWRPKYCPGCGRAVKWE